jgi:hypothetical protein
MDLALSNRKTSAQNDVIIDKLITICILECNGVHFTGTLRLLHCFKRCCIIEHVIHAVHKRPICFTTTIGFWRQLSKQN